MEKDRYWYLNSKTFMKITYEKYLKPYARALRNNPTHSEAKLWRYLKGDAFYGYDFHRQKPIGKYIVDFYCHAKALVVEVDGDIHDLQQEYDAERSNYLVARGFHILRVTNDDVKNNLVTVLQKISEACC